MTCWDDAVLVDVGDVPSQSTTASTSGPPIEPNRRGDVAGPEGRRCRWGAGTMGATPWAVRGDRRGLPAEAIAGDPPAEAGGWAVPSERRRSCVDQMSGRQLAHGRSSSWGRSSPKPDGCGLHRARGADGAGPCVVRRRTGTENGDRRRRATGPRWRHVRSRTELRGAEVPPGTPPLSGLDSPGTHRACRSGRPCCSRNPPRAVRPGS